MEFTANLNRFREALKTLLYQFQDRPKMQAWLKSYVDQLQELELVFIDLYVLRTLEFSEGVQVDGLGSIVGELRLGRDDMGYKAAIRGRIRRNRQHSRINDVLETMNLVFDNDYQLIELPIAAFILYMKQAYNPATSPSLEQLNAELQKTKGGGIRAHLQYAIFDHPDVFRFATGDVPEVESDSGFSNDIQTTGGHWSDLVG